jgi:hypothetical protein
VTYYQHKISQITGWIVGPEKVTSCRTRENISKELPFAGHKMKINDYCFIEHG